ncbi:MAG: futalosine hydrolase [Flavobacteriales bacterium]|jgi:futalosine hydrolase|nr:futalosine hydrolase [Flavobacteriales bacterium]MBT6745965.1 futalosine hydrolase [Flavobacteriales bacterium]
MRILVVASTMAEIDTFQAQNTESEIDILITGVGMVATTFRLTKVLSQNDYDIVVNAGIAGAFFKKFEIGEVVEVRSEQFPEIGVEDDNSFISIFELGLLGANEYPFQKEKLTNPDTGIPNLKLVDGVTVNKVHGNNLSIQKVVDQFSPDVESMEGAAVAFVCLQENIKFIQIRAISNYVEKRNKSAWNVPLAVRNLNIVLEKLVFKLRVDS